MHYHETWRTVNAEEKHFWSVLISIFPGYRDLQFPNEQLKKAKQSHLRYKNEILA